MKLIIYVHEFNSEVGHGHAMIETLKNFPSHSIKSIKVLAFQSTSLEDIFSDKNIDLSFVKVPFPKLTPFLVKMLFYQLYACVYSFFFVAKDEIKMSIGIAHLFPDIVNIQFLHYQWKEHYFKNTSLSIFKKIYKHLLFLFFSMGEKFVYSNQKVKIFALSKFIQKGLIDKYGRNEANTKVIYSGVNTKRFSVNEMSKVEIKKILVKKYPILENLNVDNPISLFVGAFERKGLPCLIELLKKNLAEGILDANYQFIIIGKSESGTHLNFNFHKNIFHIPFSNELPLFYSLSDQFLFPTIYEPFGLVLIEAAAMGLEVHTLSEEVGAAEILTDLPGIFTYKNQNSFKIPPPHYLSSSERFQYRKQRMDILSKYSWQKNGQDCYNFINDSN